MHKDLINKTIYDVYKIIHHKFVSFSGNNEIYAPGMMCFACSKAVKRKRLYRYGFRAIIE